MDDFIQRVDSELVIGKDLALAAIHRLKELGDEEAAGQAISLLNVQTERIEALQVYIDRLLANKTR